MYHEITPENIDDRIAEIDDNETAIAIAIRCDRQDIAEDALNEVDDVEDRTYLADRYDLPLDPEAEAYCRREHEHYIGGMPYPY